MKLKKFKERDNKKIGVVVFTLICLFLVSGAMLYRTFAIFEVKTNQNIINGQVQTGDILFTFYYKNDEGNYVITDKIPEGDYVLSTSDSYCGVVGQRDESITVSMNSDKTLEITGLSKSPSKCKLYFEKGLFLMDYGVPFVTSGSGLYAVTHDDELAKTMDVNWQQTEYRYAGPNYTDENTDYVHNYVKIEGQTWRIIGLVNTPEGQRIKLVKDESIGKFSWDTSSSSVNSGYGINEWKQSDVMKLLNEGFKDNKLEDSSGTTLSTFVNNSLYWDGEDGQCYNGPQNKTTSCSFTDSKMPASLKNMIEETTWNTGSNGNEYNADNINVNEFYNLERSSNTGKICNNVTYCNDVVTRTTSWKGNVGLIYPSDYGYATSGETATTRTNCFETKLYNWRSSNECKNNDWLLFNSWYWTLSPIAFSGNSYRVFAIHTDGKVGIGDASSAGGVHPTVYLKSNVKIVSGSGAYNDQFVLAIQ